MQLKQKIKRLEKFLRPASLDVSKLSDAELEAIAGRDARLSAVFETLSDTELEAVRDNNLAALSWETLEKMRDVYSEANQKN